MECPYKDFWFDGNYGCLLDNSPCEDLCDIANEFEDDSEDYLDDED